MKRLKQFLRSIFAPTVHKHYYGATKQDWEAISKDFDKVFEDLDKVMKHFNRPKP